MKIRGFLGAGPGCSRIRNRTALQALGVAPAATWRLILLSLALPGWKTKGPRSHTRCPPEPVPRAPIPRYLSLHLFLESESVPTRLAATHLLSPLPPLPLCALHQHGAQAQLGWCRPGSGPAPTARRQIFH